MLLIFSVEWLVIDESDKLFEDGETGFRQQVSNKAYLLLKLQHRSDRFSGFEYI